MRKDLPAERSPAKSEGVAGLRKFLFRPADGAGEGVDHRMGGFGVFWACTGLSLDKMSCRTMCVAWCWLRRSSTAPSRLMRRPKSTGLSSIISEADMRSDW